MQEVVVTGADIDLTKLPVHLQHGKDGGPYISAGIDFARDPATGLDQCRACAASCCAAARPPASIWSRRATCATSISRRWRAASGCRSASWSAAIRSTISAPPCACRSTSSACSPRCARRRCRWSRASPTICASRPTPNGCSKAISARKATRNRKAPTANSSATTAASRPIRCSTSPPSRGGAMPLFQTLTIGGATMSCTDTAQLRTLRTEVLIWRALETAIREPVAVYAPPATGGVLQRAHRHAPARAGRGAQRDRGGVRFARQRQERVRRRSRHRHLLRRADGMGDGHALPAAIATSSCRERASAPSRSILRSASHASLGAKAGYDLTMPIGGTARSSKPKFRQPPHFEGARFASVEEALRDGPKFFEQLMAAVGSDDGREIVLELEELRRAGPPQARPARRPLPPDRLSFLAKHRDHKRVPMIGRVDPQLHSRRGGSSPQSVCGYV